MKSINVVGIVTASVLGVGLVANAIGTAIPTKPETTREMVLSRGSLVLNKPVRGCWVKTYPNNCTTFEANYEWTIHNFGDTPKGRAFCISNGFFIGAKEKSSSELKEEWTSLCAWTPPLSEEAYRLKVLKKDCHLRKACSTEWSWIALTATAATVPGEDNDDESGEFQFPSTVEYVAPGHPKRDRRRYAAFLLAGNEIYAHECMSHNDRARTRKLDWIAKFSSSFSEEERSQGAKNARYELKRLGRYEYCRINYRAMEAPAM